jgi:hypothetical protein
LVQKDFAGFSIAGRAKRRNIALASAGDNFDLSSRTVQIFKLFEIIGGKRLGSPFVQPVCGSPRSSGAPGNRVRRFEARRIVVVISADIV